VQGDKLPLGVAMAAFDCAVNSGVSEAVKLLQLAAGTTADGALGPITMAAVAAANPADLATETIVRRAVFMASLSTFPTFGLGWMRRVFSLRGSIE
jgi:lysozyme family protein